MVRCGVRGNTVNRIRQFGMVSVDVSIHLSPPLPFKLREFPQSGARLVKMIFFMPNFPKYDKNGYAIKWDTFPCSALFTDNDNAKPSMRWLYFLDRTHGSLVDFLSRNSDCCLVEIVFDLVIKHVCCINREYPVENDEEWPKRHKTTENGVR